MGDRTFGSRADRFASQRADTWRPGNSNFRNDRVTIIPRSTHERPPQRDFAVCSHYDNRTHMTKDTGISRREMFERKYGASMVYDREYFSPGTIIHANHFEEAWNQNPCASYAETMVIGKNGEKICTKQRYLIVVAQNDSCYTTVPVFTHEGNGLEFKQAKHEYISIRDHTIPANGFESQSTHEPVVTEHLKYPVTIKPSSTAWLTYPVSRQYFLPVNISGRLDNNSTERLVALYQKFMANKLDITQIPSGTAWPSKRGVENAGGGSVKSTRLNGRSTPRSATERQRQAIENLLLGSDSFANESEGRNAPRRKNSHQDDAGF